MSESNTAHRIIEAADTPASIGPGDLALTIAWPDGSETVEHVSEKAAAVLGYRYPDEPPAPPAWMVEVAREVNARSCDKRGLPAAAAAYRAGTEDGEDTIARSIETLRLALERGHVVEAREWTEDALLKAAREDAAQVNERRGNQTWARDARAGKYDNCDDVQCALQARRNMLREGTVAVPTKAPEVDLEALVKRAWEAGANSVRSVVHRHLQALAPNVGTDAARNGDVSEILRTLPTREA